MSSKERIKAQEDIGFRILGAYQSTATGISWCKGEAYEKVYNNPEFRWSTSDLVPDDIRYTLPSIVTMPGKTHLKNPNTGEYYYLGILDTDCQTAYNRLSIPIRQLLDSSSWDWVTPRLSELTEAFLKETGVENGNYEDSLLDVLKKSGYVTKTKKEYGYHIPFLDTKQRPAIGSADCKTGMEFELKTDNKLGLCTLPDSPHREDPSFRYEEAGRTDRILVSDIFYDLVVEMFKDCFVNSKLDDTPKQEQEQEQPKHEQSQSNKEEEESDLKLNDLSSSGVKATAGYLSDFIVRGHRHYFYLYLSGMTFYYGISLRSAFEIVSLLCNMTNDEEKKYRLEDLRLTYEKGFAGKPLKGGKSLADLIAITVPQYKRNKEAAKVVLEILRKIWSKDISLEGEDKEWDKKLSQEVIELLRPGISLLFKDDSNTAFAAVNMDGGEHRNIVPIKNKRFNLWVRRMYYELAGNTLGSEIISEVAETLESEALFDGPTKKLEPRINRDPDDPFVYWYDLGNEEWNAVRITPEGWSIVESENVPIVFRRYAGQLPQVIPSREYPNDIFDQFMKLLNIKDDLQIRLVYQCYIISLFIPAIAKAVFIAQGPQGATKTTFQDLTKLVTDPCKVTSVTPPRNEEQLMQLLQHNAIVYFDNMSYMPEWLSNAMCRAATGTAGLKRELYTNDEDIIYQYKRAIGFNGIALAANRADLLDRSFIVEIESVTDETRRTLEDDILPELERLKPQLFGFILDILVKMLHIKANGGIKLKSLSRMADFEKHCEMISQCLGHKPLEFVNTYRANKDIGTKDILESSSTANAILEFMNNRVDAWSGYASQLLNELETIALTKLKIDIQKDKGWPRSGNLLSRRLRELKHSLLKAGIMVFWIDNPRENRRFINIGKVSPTSPTSPAAGDSSTSKTDCTGDTGDTGDVFTNTEGDPNKTRIYRLYVGGDRWGCQDCDVKGDIWYMQDHKCKSVKKKEEA